MTSSASVTVFGLNFGASDVSPTVLLELSGACSSTSWTTVTAITCLAESFGGGTRRTVVTVRAAVGTGDGLIFTYDGTAFLSSTVFRLVRHCACKGCLCVMSCAAPVLSMLAPPNFPRLGGAAITLFGTNFGQTNLSATVQTGDTRCLSTVWASGTSLFCQSSPGSGPGSAPAIGSSVVLISTLAGTNLQSVFFDTTSRCSLARVSQSSIC